MGILTNVEMFNNAKLRNMEHKISVNQYAIILSYQQYPFFKHFVYSITSNKNLIFSKDCIFVYTYGNKNCTRELMQQCFHFSPSFRFYLKNYIPVVFCQQSLPSLTYTSLYFPPLSLFFKSLNRDQFVPLADSIT